MHIWIIKEKWKKKEKLENDVSYFVEMAHFNKEIEIVFLKSQMETLKVISVMMKMNSSLEKISNITKQKEESYETWSQRLSSWWNREERQTKNKPMGHEQAH
jgi:uncharacterized protein YccT (UPF0319 family)